MNPINNEFYNVHAHDPTTSCPEPLNSLPAIIIQLKSDWSNATTLFDRSHAALLFAFYCSVLQFYVCMLVNNLPSIDHLATVVLRYQDELTTWLHVVVLRYQDESYGVCIPGMLGIAIIDFLLGLATVAVISGCFYNVQHNA